ncbi:lipase [Amycolatopsis antarctica]|uniref:Lipase n=1 Tax=Amycolatopsis antarctica TaxID=1854586 RepID=A0A263D8F7_9PSEU|nr:alpha/beta fold hydrolase [Amycolatopsis antarctica]OZM73766.1 lipase [Amycolatopsis antarctica]
MSRTPPRRVLGATVTALLSVAALLFGSGHTASAAPARQTYPVVYSLAGGFVANPGSLDPNRAPAGSNIWSCEPSPEKPEPVILLHGLGGNQGLNFPAISPLLANNGYCVFSLTYGKQWWLPTVGGLRSMPDSARELSALVDRVLTTTGASKVKLVGHSEGTTIASYYLKALDGAKKADALVGFSPNYAGTTLYGLTELAQNLPPFLNAVLESVCMSCKEFGRGTPFMDELNAGGTAAVPGVTYTNIQPALEEVVLPNSSGQLDVPNATNHRVDEGCAADLSDHVSVVTSKRGNQIMLNALDPADAKPLPCAFNPPFLS